MAQTFSAIALAGVLIVGLVVGVGIGYFASGGNHLATTSTVTSVTTTAFTTTVVSTASSSQTSTGSQSGLSAAQIEAALAAAPNATLTVASYDYGKGSLDAWVQNSGNVSIILTPSECLLNGTLQKVTYFSALDPKIVQFGVYYYIPPGVQIVLTISPNSIALGGRNSTLTIFNNVFTFTYGTSKS